MIRLEERLRSALAQDPPQVAVEQFLADVRRGARRRSNRRTAMVSATVAAMTVVAIGVAAWWPAPSTPEPAPPAPAPVPNLAPLSGRQLMAPVPTGPDGRLYGLSVDKECTSRCPRTLWIEDRQDRPTGVHAFPPDQAISWVAMAPDLTSGFAFGGNNGTLVLRTHDGGHTWQQVDEHLADYAFEPNLVVLGDEAYLTTRSFN